ncbi:hypothetical protein AB0C40_29175 [Streptomyces brevispora]|uniref:hypothetical protein n=1 Tax=Streptomyces brevispora TaxID=887462 RepID=UPI0033CF7DAE
MCTATLPRCPDHGPTAHRFVPRPVSEVCAFVGDDDTGINDDGILAGGYCLPCTGPGEYTIGAEGGSVTAAVYHFG